MEQNYASLSFLSVYIDDGSGVSFDDALIDASGEPVMRQGVPLTRAVAHFEAALRVLTSLGHASTVGKEQPPARKIDSLGCEVDLDGYRLRLLPLKRKSYAAAVGKLLDGGEVCSRNELLSVLGKLSFAASCYPVGRQWLHAAWRAARASFRFSHGDWAGGAVRLSRRARDGLFKWHQELLSPRHDGVPLGRPLSFPPPESEGSGAIYADASGEDGWGAWALDGRRLLVTYGEWTEAELADASFIIAEKELLASTLGLVSLAKAANWRSVWSFTDNTVAMSAMRKLTPRTTRMQHMVAARSFWMLSHGVREAAERITSKNNDWADALSRRGLDRVISEAQNMGLEVVVVESPSEWRQADWDQPTTAPTPLVL